MKKMSEGRVLKPGDVVVYTDQFGVKHDALVTVYWDGGKGETGKALNLVYVVKDESKSDSYGRQIERATSVSMRSEGTAHGRFYECV